MRFVPRRAHADLRAGEPGQVKRVQRLVQLEEHVVGGIDDIVDRPGPRGAKPGLQPLRRRPHCDPSNDGREVAEAAIAVLDRHAHTAGGGRLLARLPARRPYGSPERRQHQIAHAPRRELTRHTRVARQVDAVRREVDLQSCVRQADGLDEGIARRVLVPEAHDARRIPTQAKFLLGAQHPVAFLPTDLAALDLESAGQRATRRYERIERVLRHVRSSADHVEQVPTPGIHPTQGQPIRVGVLSDFDDATHDHVGELVTHELGSIDRNGARAERCGQLIGRAFDRRRQGAKPVDANVHQANCSRKPTSAS